jgi:hypothetical protein
MCSCRAFRRAKTAERPPSAPTDDIEPPGVGGCERPFGLEVSADARTCCWQGRSVASLPQEPNMSAPQLESLKTRLENVIALARLLERVEGSGVVIGADQYRALVLQVTLALAQDLPAQALQAVLRAHPAAAELYENMHYAQSGLSCSTLERSIGSEMLASQVIARAARIR